MAHIKSELLQFSGTTTKDTCTEPRRGGGGSKGGRWVWLGLGGGVGVNADNCN